MQDCLSRSSIGSPPSTRCCRTSIARCQPEYHARRAGVHWAIDFGACLLIDRLARGADRSRASTCRPIIFSPAKAGLRSRRRSVKAMMAAAIDRQLFRQRGSRIGCAPLRRVGGLPDADARHASCMAGFREDYAETLLGCKSANHAGGTRMAKSQRQGRLGDGCRHRHRRRRRVGPGPRRRNRRAHRPAQEPLEVVADKIAEGGGKASCSRPT